MVPMNQWLRVVYAVGVDEWGQSLPGDSVSCKARITEKTSVVRGPNGQESVSSAEILLPGLVKMGVNDVLEWEDEVGNVYSFRPLSIFVVRDFGGKPMLTRVVV